MQRSRKCLPMFPPKFSLDRIWIPRRVQDVSESDRIQGPKRLRGPKVQESWNAGAKNLRFAYGYRWCLNNEVAWASFKKIQLSSPPLFLPFQNIVPPCTPLVDSTDKRDNNNSTLHANFVNGENRPSPEFSYLHPFNRLALWVETLSRYFAWDNLLSGSSQPSKNLRWESTAARPAFLTIIIL